MNPHSHHANTQILCFISMLQLTLVLTDRSYFPNIASAKTATLTRTPWDQSFAWGQKQVTKYPLSVPLAYF